MKTKITYIAGAITFGITLAISSIVFAATAPRVNSFQAVYAEIDKIWQSLTSNRPLHVYDANGQDLGIMISGADGVFSYSQQFITKIGDTFFRFESNNQDNLKKAYPLGGSIYFSAENCAGPVYTSAISKNAAVFINNNFYKTKNGEISFVLIKSMIRNETDMSCDNNVNPGIVSTSVEVEKINPSILLPLKWPLEVK